MDKRFCGHMRGSESLRVGRTKAKGEAEDEKTKTKWPNLGTRGVGANLGPISGHW